MNNRRVRVRFAPSPTGPLHIGGVRTALFNYFFAKKHGGDFILRIEDTDQKRYVEGAEEYIIKSLKWCGLEFDESVEKGGDYAPYRQSERKEIYKQYSDKLIKSDNAYYAFDTPEELDVMRTRLQEAKSSTQQYNAITRNEMKNSLTMSAEKVKQMISAGEPFVIRFKMPENENIIVNDIIRGEITVNSNQLDDKVLFKSDGMPTYHLANIVDDYSMKISHVIRGEEWLPSLPLHVMLYNALGWNNATPQFAHLPLLLKPNGKGKLSKRDGDKMGFPVFPLEWKDPKTNEVSTGYKESGYFADGFVNMLAFLGWNPGTEQEIFSLEEMAQAFSLEKAGKSGSKFDPEKAKWFNHQYLIRKDNAELAKLFAKELSEKELNVEPSLLSKIVGLTKERVNFVSELWEQTSYFFAAPVEYEAKMVKKQWKEATPDIMQNIKKLLSQQESFDSANLETNLKKWIKEQGLGMGKVMTPLRLVLVGGGFGIHLFDIMEIIGKEETLRRIETGIETIKK